MVKQLNVHVICTELKYNDNNNSQRMHYVFVKIIVFSQSLRLYYFDFFTLYYLYLNTLINTLGDGFIGFIFFLYQTQLCTIFQWISFSSFKLKT